MKSFQEKLEYIKNSKYLNISRFLPCNKCEVRGICPEFKKDGKCKLGRRVIEGRVKGGLDPVDIVEDQILKLYDQVTRLELSGEDIKSKEVLNKMVTGIGNLAKKKFDMENTPRLDVDVHIDIFDLINEAEQKTAEKSTKSDQ